MPNLRVQLTDIRRKHAMSMNHSSLKHAICVLNVSPNLSLGRTPSTRREPSCKPSGRCTTEHRISPDPTISVSNPSMTIGSSSGCCTTSVATATAEIRKLLGIVTRAMRTVARDLRTIYVREGHCHEMSSKP